MRQACVVVWGRRLCVLVLPTDGSMYTPLVAAGSAPMYASASASAVPTAPVYGVSGGPGAVAGPYHFTGMVPAGPSAHPSYTNHGAGTGTGY